MKFAYADPPYLGCGALYVKHHPDALDWNDPEMHRALIERLCDGYPDGWAMSATSVSLRTLLPMTPGDCRVGAWVKPFAAFKPNVRVAYAWEPLIFRGGRKGTRQQATVRDWVAENITLRRGLTGAKPRAFCRWVFDLLNGNRGMNWWTCFQAQTQSGRHGPTGQAISRLCRCCHWRGLHRDNWPCVHSFPNQGNTLALLVFGAAKSIVRRKNPN